MRASSDPPPRADRRPSIPRSGHDELEQLPALETQHDEAKELDDVDGLPVRPVEDPTDLFEGEARGGPPLPETRVEGLAEEAQVEPRSRQEQGLSSHGMKWASHASGMSSCKKWLPPSRITWG